MASPRARFGAGGRLRALGRGSRHVGQVLRLGTDGDLPAKGVVAWCEWGYLSLALEVGAPQLLDARLAPRIARALDEFELEGREFELHFSMDMLLHADPVDLAPMLLELKAHGLQLTVDGFSVGAQLLENWRGWPLDNLSLEGGILNSVPANHVDRLLLTALISLAHGIGLKVNASDIESEELHGLLRRLQCDGIRRYRSDTALPPRKVESVLRRRRLF